MSDPENVAEEAKGRAKEALGAITGSDELREEGKAQQEKAEKREEAREKEAEAQQARAEAQQAEAEEKQHQ